MHRRLIFLLAVMAALTISVAACGAPKSSGFSPIALGNIPDGLTGTTTTTTTMPATTSTIEFVATTTTTPQATTTTPNTAVTLFFITGQQLASQQQYTSSSAEALVVLGLLGDGPENPVGGQRTAIPKDSTFRTSEFRGVLTVDLPLDFFDRVGASDRYDERLAIGQIVLTLTKLSGVSQVRFTLNNEPIGVPLGTGETSDSGGVLVKEDYSALLGSAPPPTTTTVVVEPRATDPALESTTAVTG